MKKMIMLSISLMSVAGSFAQTLADINEIVKKNQYAAAKTAIDKYLADPKTATEANAWYFKGTIYNNYSNDSTLSSAASYDLKVKAMEAYQKTLAMDKLDLYLKTDEYRPFLYIYSGMYNLGAKQFNDKDYLGAYNSFRKAEETENFILDKKYVYTDFRLNRLDTSLLLNMAAAARNLKNDTGAVRIYRRLVDANAANTGNEDVYLFLVDYYRQQKDEANLKATLAKAKTAYPSNSIWDDVEVEAVTKSGDKNAMFAKYEELYSKNPANFTNTYNYGVELYNSVYGKEPNNPDPAAAKERLTVVLKSAIAADTTNDANMLMANHLYAYASEYSQESALISGTKPEDVKKKKDLAALSNVKLDEMIPYAEKTVQYYQGRPPTKASQKINYKNALDYLSEVYTIKKNTAKAAEYDKLRDAIKF